ncbi:MAG: CoA transferase [Acidimicrobiia bacterium]
MMLADMGADVFRIDSPGGPRFETPAGDVVPRGKRSITLDLHDPAGVGEARVLAATAEIVIENLQAGDDATSRCRR